MMTAGGLIAAAAGEIVLMLLYAARVKGKIGGDRHVFKVLPTLLPVFLGLSGALMWHRNGSGMTVAGLVLCAAADWLIEDAFLPGMGCFALAHLALIAGFLTAGGVNIGTAVLFAAFLAPLLYLLIRFRKGLKPFPAYVLYAVLLCAMAALSYGQSPLAGIGGLLFVLSDSILGCRRAGLRMPRFSSALCLGAYWTGLTLIAFSLLI